MAQSIKADPTLERLLNLTVAMMSSAYGLTKAEIFELSSDYKTSSDSDLANASRMFERDKATLKESGISFETITDPETAHDPRTTRYRIPVKDYAFPATISFDNNELALLQLSARAWADKTATPEAISILAKLKAMGYESDDSLAGSAPKIQMLPPGFELIADAIRQQHSTKFSYLMPDAELPLLRDVQALQLFRYDGRWLLFAYDHDRRGERMFLLDRFTSTASKSLTPVVAEQYQDVRVRARKHLDARLFASRASLSVAPNSIAALHLRRLNGVLISENNDELLLEVPMADEELLAQELASYGPEVVVIAPESLKSRLVNRLQNVKKLMEQEG